MKTNLYIFLLLVLTAGSSKAQSLDYFVALAKENQPALQAERIKNKALETREHQYSALQDPMFSVGYNVTPNSMERVTASAMQNFSWFGTAKKQKEAARKGAQSSLYSLAAKENQLEIAVSDLYFDIQELTKQLTLQKEMLLTFESFEVLATNKLATSKGSMVDVARAEIEKNKASLQIDIIELKISNLKEALNRMVQRAPNTPIDLVLIDDFVMVEEVALEEHPEMKAATTKQEEMELLTAVAKKEASPQLGIGVDYMQMNPIHHEFMPMVSLTIPIYRKKYRAKIEETTLLRKAYDQEKEALRIEHYRARDAVKSQLQQLGKERALYESQIDRLKKAKELLLTYYSTSGSDFEELIRLQQEENTYKNDLISAQTAYLKLNKEWEYLNSIAQ